MKKTASILFLLVLCIVSNLKQSNAQDFPWESELKSRMELLADSLTTNLKPWIVPDSIFRVEDYGAIADGSTMNTQAIQKAIDSCSAAGGGVVLFSSGDYHTGTIQLKSGVMIEVAEEARILGSIEIADYPEMVESLESIMSEYYKFTQSLFYAEKADKIGIRGNGEIYFRGERANFPGPQTSGEIVDRPLGFRIIECKNVVFQDIFLHNSAAWMVNLVYSEDIIFDGVKIENHANFNNDGLDPDGCRNLIVRNCFFNTEDDAMCPKGASNKVSENYLIENSTFVTTCNAFKIGTDTQGSFKNIIARNLTLGGIPDSLVSSSGRESSTGITIATVDGGNVEDFYIHNVNINQARCPVFIRIGKRGRVLPDWPTNIGYIRNILIENVEGKDNFRQGSFISGVDGHKIDNIIIRNYNLEMEGGGSEGMAGASVTEDEYGYPDAHQFSVGGLPAYGFYVRYAEKVWFDTVQIVPVNNDDRPEFISGGDTEDVLVNGEEIQEVEVYIYLPKYIENLEVNASGSTAKVDSARNGALPFNDRSFTFASLPQIIKSAEYICWENNSKSINKSDLISFEVKTAGTVYVAHDDRLAKPSWLSDNYTETNDNISLNGTKSTLWKKQVTENETIITGSNQIPGTETTQTNNYVLFFQSKNNVSVFDKLPFDSLFQFWPNPASDKLTVNYHGNETAIVLILDLTGKTVLKQEITNEDKTIDLNQLKSGYYIISASGSDWSVSKKLLINNR